MLQDAISKSLLAGGKLVDEIRATWQVSIRRACSVLRAERSSYHYKGKRRPQAVLMKRIKEIAETRVRVGNSSG